GAALQIAEESLALLADLHVGEGPDDQHHRDPDRADQPYREFHAWLILPGGPTAASVYRTRQPARTRSAVDFDAAPERSLQTMEGEDAPADQLDLAGHVVLRALPALVGQRVSRIPQRPRAELVAARVGVKRRRQRVGQRDAVQHGPRRRPPA